MYAHSEYRMGMALGRRKPSDCDRLRFWDARAVAEYVQI